MGLKEKFDELNKKPNAIYYYIGGILVILFTIGLISNPKAMGETLSAIIGLILWLAICYFCFKYFGRSKQQQQQQQNVRMKEKLLFGLIIYPKALEETNGL